MKKGAGRIALQRRRREAEKRVGVSMLHGHRKKTGTCKRLLVGTAFGLGPCLGFGFGHAATKLRPDLDERLGFRVAPGEPGFLKFVGAATPQLAKFDGPTGDHASIRQRMKRRCRRTPVGRAFRVGRGRLRGSAKSGTPGCRVRFCRILGSRILVPEFHGEPSLDTPNARPPAGRLQGPKLAHGRHLLVVAIEGSRQTTVNPTSLF